MSTRRKAAARGTARNVTAAAVTANGAPVALAAGPDASVWGAHPGDLFGAWQAWKTARDAWALEQGIDTRGADYALLPPELFDRRPFSTGGAP